MKLKGSKGSSLAILSTAVTLAVMAGSANATHSWATYHWARSSNPLVLTLGDNLTSNWDSYLATASSDWSASTVLNTSVVPGGTTARRCSPAVGKVEVCNLTYGNNGWLGIASISISGGHIVSGSVKVNDTYFNTATYNTPAWRNLVMCQEVGHIFGLDHQDENFNNANLNTCMDYTNNPSTNQHPNAHDYEQLELIYSHLDGAALTPQEAAAGLPPAMQDLEMTGPGSWGRVVASYADGRGRLYELDFGHGNKILTHVFWVPEEGGRQR